MLNKPALILATTLGTVLQVAMVVAGHSNTTIASLFAVGGMGISLLAGLLYTMRARGSTGASMTLGGAIAGGVSAFVGILISHLLGDVPTSLLLLGTASSVVTGIIGAWVGRVVFRGVVVAGILALALAKPQLVGAQAGATVADFRWLAGCWSSELASGVGTAHVVYDGPHGGVLTGVMHLVSKKGEVLVVELISLVDTPRGVEMRFRHFSPSLEAYETDFQQAMLLKSHNDNADVFENQVAYSRTLMSTQTRVTRLLRQQDGSFIGKSDIIGENGKPAIIEGHYRRALAPSTGSG
jgi:hypothetical protein